MMFTALIMAAALQYDSIARVGYGTAAPATFGSFAADYQTITSGSHLANAHEAHPTAHLITTHDLIGAVLSPGLGSLIGLGKKVAIQTMANAMYARTYANVDKALAPIANGVLRRYTLYDGWVRVDDPLTHTAVIHKDGKYIALDLARHVYGISDTAPQQAMQLAIAPAPVSTETSTLKQLDAQTYETYPTTGQRTDWTFLPGLGHCGKAWHVAQLQYTIPTLAFAAPALEGVAQSAQQTIGPICAAAPPPPTPAPGFVVYSQISLIMSDIPNMPNFETDSIVERGNIKVLTDAQAQALFAIPPGFTPQK